MTEAAPPPTGRPAPPERSDRALLVLGTAAQTPTLDRHHNAAVLRWDDELILFDPGEGAQTQLERGGVKPARIDRICLTHLHGDHCLGLPGVIERRSNDDVDRPLHVHYPAASEGHLLKLLDATEDTGRVDLRLHPVHEDGPVATDGPYRLLAMALDHTVPTVGWRLEEPDGVHLLAERLEEAGVHGAAVGRLRRDGEVTVDGRQVRLVDVAVPRPGQVMAWVMDTRVCVAATLLARGADLLVCEATYRAGEEDLADAHGHLSAAQAARVAHDARARRLVLTHYSRRHPDAAVFADDARAALAALDDPTRDDTLDVVAAEDLTWVEVPVRERPTR